MLFSVNTGRGVRLFKESKREVDGGEGRETKRDCLTGPLSALFLFGPGVGAAVEGLGQ